MDILTFLDEILINEDLASVKSNVHLLLKKININNKQNKQISYRLNGENLSIKNNFLAGELNQILETQTLERTKYYLNRLIKGLVETKTGKINDLNLNRWKEYDDLITDSLWIINKRDQSGAHKADYWGNFIPQIPNQFLRRYTKKGEWVLDPFAGSGTTLIECKRLGRNGIGIELNPDVAKIAKDNLKKEISSAGSIIKIITGNSCSVDLKAELKKEGIDSVQFIIMHPPYWNIIRFSKMKNDLSNAETVKDFLKMFGSVIDNTSHLLDKGRYLAIVIGDKYSSGEWIPLGFYVMQEAVKRGLKLKSTIVKNFDTTKGKMNQKELWRYRALVGGFYIFKHEYIFLFQK